MSILSGKEVIKPYIKKATGYIKSLVSSQHVEMNDGKTLQAAVDELDGKLTNLNSYDFNTPVIIGYRDNKPVYKIIKQFSSSDYNFSINGEIKLKVPEIYGKRILKYNAAMTASYGTYNLPYINYLAKSITWIRCVYNTEEWNVQYFNTGDSWGNWRLEVEILYQ